MILSTLDDIHLLVCTPNLFPSSYTLRQPVLIASTSDEKYSFGVLFEVLIPNTLLKPCLFDVLHFLIYRRHVESSLELYHASLSLWNVDKCFRRIS